jgi:hypothetical protein
MSFMKKSDVKNHLSPRHQNHIHIVPVSQPDATGFSGTDQLPVEQCEPAFTQDFTADHSTRGKTVAPAAAPNDSPQPPADFRAAKL